MEDMRNSYKIFIGKPEGTKPLRRPRRRWEYNIIMHSGKQFGRMLIGFIWLKIWTSGGLL
jgi:hypothetical protein